MTKNGHTAGQGEMTRKPPRHGKFDARPSGNGPELTGAEAAEYIASMLRGLHSLAQSAQLPFLAYLIDIAREEATAERAGKERSEN